MRYLLDTNAWLRWFHRPQEICLSTSQLLNAAQVVTLSPMSIIEVAQKAHKGKLILPLPVDVWVRQSLPADRVKLLPISVDVALSAYTWPADFHGDPADRIISSPGPDRSAESCPRGWEKRPPSQLKPSPPRQNAATRISRSSRQERISNKTAPPRSKSRNSARVDQTPSEKREKAFPKD